LELPRRTSKILNAGSWFDPVMEGNPSEGRIPRRDFVFACIRFMNAIAPLAEH
jgi:hypothetical protein